ncbi:hypothetical protein KJ678_03115, partial [Patescibacteria group bacterium]|nr:hypothetical protein [Patescibacteria group bacterium]
MEKRRVIWMAIWMAICVLILVALFFLPFSRDKIIMGSDVEFVTDLNHTLIVSAEVVTVEAASLYRPFAVRTSNGESIVSVPMTLPLGVKGFEDN